MVTKTEPVPNAIVSSRLFQLHMGFQQGMYQKKHDSPQGLSISSVGQKQPAGD